MGDPVGLESKKWSVVYPVFINSRKKIPEGRRVSKAKGVDNPTAQEIYEVCKHLGFRCELEPEKAHPRDSLQKGRVRVLIKSDGQAVQPEIHSKGALLVKLGELVPKLQSRQGGGGPSGGGSSGGKGGKGGRRRGR